jgi:hypothetical protein
VGSGSIATTAGGSFINIMAHLLSQARPGVLPDQSLRAEKSRAAEDIVKCADIMNVALSILVI